MLVADRVLRVDLIPLLLPAAELVFDQFVTFASRLTELLMHCFPTSTFLLHLLEEAIFVVCMITAADLGVFLLRRVE